MGKVRYCGTCEGKGELNEDGLCSGCQGDVDQAAALGLTLDEYKRATYGEAGALPEIPSDRVYIRWAFKTLEGAAFCKRVLTRTMTEDEEEAWNDQTVACNFGTSSRDGVDDEDAGHDEQAAGFEMTDPGAALTVDKAKVGRRVFYVVTYTADGEAARTTVEGAEEYAGVSKGTYGPWYSPTGFPEAVDPTSKKGGRVNTGEAWAWGDTIAWPAVPAPEAKADPDMRGALDALLEAHGWPEVLAALALEAQDQAGDMGAHMDTAKEDEGKADRLAADLTALAAWVNGVKP